MKSWQDGGRNLYDQPPNNRIRDRNLVNVAPLQFGEEIALVHFGTGNPIFWQSSTNRGSP